MAVGQDFFGKLRQFDAYPKTLEDFRVKTYGGAASMSLLGSLRILFEFVLLAFHSYSS